MKKIKMSKWKKGLLAIVCVGVGLALWKESAEGSARWHPDYAMEDLPVVESVSDLSPDQLDFLLYQTGLSEIGLLRLEKAGRLEELDYFQRAFFLEGAEVSPKNVVDWEIPFSQLPYDCLQNSPISWEEYVLDGEGNRGAYLPLVPLEAGDILLTPNSHSFGYRQGHAAMVVDVDLGWTLESVVLGSNSITQWTTKWQGFPAVLVLRASEDLGEMAAEYALEYLLDVPYDLTVGVFSAKNLDFGEKARGTQCSHLVWQAYAWCGLDLDANGWGLVTPYNLSQSQDLELVQIWGMDPDLLWCET